VRHFKHIFFSVRRGFFYCFSLLFCSASLHFGLGKNNKPPLIIWRELFSNSVRSLVRLRLSFFIASRSCVVRSQGVAHYYHSVAVLSLCRRSSSSAPSPAPRYYFRSSALRHSKNKKPFYTVDFPAVFCFSRFAGGRLFRQSLKTIIIIAFLRKLRTTIIIIVSFLHFLILVFA
jgi:hypothetical protein